MSHTYKRSDLPQGVDLDLVTTEEHRIRGLYYRALRELVDGRAHIPNNWIRWIRPSAQTLYQAGLIDIKEEDDPDILRQIKKRGSHRKPGYVYCRLLHYALALYLLGKYEHRKPVIED
ncbi:MAG: hypothetical protein J4428_03095 [Candidatus Aenigmarchaeota archaeon]|nr:hypothetical protein [Candidatus Aenigmarchaeota archaeon]